MANGCIVIIDCYVILELCQCGVGVIDGSSLCGMVPFFECRIIPIATPVPNVSLVDISATTRRRRCRFTNGIWK